MTWLPGATEVGGDTCGPPGHRLAAVTSSGMHAGVLQGMGAWILGHSAPGHSAVWSKVKAPTRRESIEWVATQYPETPN